MVTLLGNSAVTIQVGSTYTDPGATAFDGDDGDLASSIVVTGTFDTTTLGTYVLSYNVTDANANAAVEVIRTVNVVDIVSINTRVLLQGPYDANTGLMRDDLRVNGLLQTTSPYPDNATADAAVFNLGGISGVGLAENDIVDWIWVELRDENDYTIIIESKSALLQRDGDIVNTDGTSNLIFNTFEGNYYVLVNHRNHLGILSAAPIVFSGTTTVDFSSNQNVIFGGVNALADMGENVYAMFSGDFDSNGQVQNSDASDVILLLGSSGYSPADMDMNGQVQNTDINNIITPNTGNGEQF